MQLVPGAAGRLERIGAGARPADDLAGQAGRGTNATVSRVTFSAAIVSAEKVTRETVALIAAAGLACEIIGGAGTGTYPLEAASGTSGTSCNAAPTCSWTPTTGACWAQRTMPATSTRCSC